MLYRCLLAAMALSWATTMPALADSMPKDAQQAGPSKGRLHSGKHQTGKHQTGKHQAGKARIGKHHGARRSARHQRITAAGARQPAPVFQGRVSFYGKRFHGRTTANGERFDQRAMTMAHLSLPFNTLVRVTNLQTQHSVVVRVNDRGPYIRGRVADLSHGAAARLDMLKTGVVMARLEVLGQGARQAAAAPEPVASVQRVAVANTDKRP